METSSIDGPKGLKAAQGWSPLLKCVYGDHFIEKGDKYITRGNDCICEVHLWACKEIIEESKNVH